MNMRLKKKCAEIFIGLAVLAAVCMSAGLAGRMTARAEEAFGYFDEAGNWIVEIPEEAVSEEMPAEDVYEETVQEPAEVQKTGTYTAAEGWSVDDAASTSETTVYKQAANVGMDGVSTISCSYLDTNYSVMEYEQLRDMLTNNLLYSNVNAQISASAVYTNVRDYLYILIVDDTAEEYRNIYCYVVGDYRCFCAEVKEYRAEAEQLAAQGSKTPLEAGQGMAESFVWDS